MWIDGKGVGSGICDGPGEQSRTLVVHKKHNTEAGKQVAGSLQFSAIVSEISRGTMDCRLTTDRDRIRSGGREN
jgi:hypothetical protein